MKVILTGSTGLIGGEVLAHCLNHPAITSVLVLTRRDPGSAANHPKAKVVIVKDFLSYDDHTVSEIQTADAAIWCMGTFHGDEKVDIGYPLAFIEIIKARSQASTQFRYIQLGGAFAEAPPKDGQTERSLWFYPNGRRVRGAAEAKVLEQSGQEGSQSGFEVYLVKPAIVLSKNRTIIQRCVFGDTLSIKVNELGATMVDLAVNGNEQKVFRNPDIIKHGKGLQETST